MVKRYEPRPVLLDGVDTVGMLNTERGEYVLHEDYEKALALIAEMKELLTYTAPFCNVRGDYAACMRLAAQAEELLK